MFLITRHLNINDVLFEKVAEVVSEFKKTVNNLIENGAEEQFSVFKYFQMDIFFKNLISNFVLFCMYCKSTNSSEVSFSI